MTNLDLLNPLMQSFFPKRSVKMIDGSEKRNRQLAFQPQNSHVCEKRSNGTDKWNHRQTAYWAKISFLRTEFKHNCPNNIKLNNNRIYNKCHTWSFLVYFIPFVFYLWYLAFWSYDTSIS